jgi:signal-transduction protein with cAMP-binding, CBS, and nucleotidyltransferase domain
MAERVAEVMTGHPTTLPATTTIGDAARAMRDHGIGDVIVVDEDHRLCGIVTDRDIVVRAVADSRGPEEVRLSAICSRDVATVEPDTSLQDALSLMRLRALRRLPVVEAGRPIGVLSLGDVAIERETGAVLADISAAPSNG